MYYSHQPTHVVASEAFPSSVDVDIDYVHFGGTLRVAPGTPLEPYVVGSIGATRCCPRSFPARMTSNCFRWDSVQACASRFTKASTCCWKGERS